MDLQISELLIIESLRLEKSSKNIQSNHQLMPTTPTKTMYLSARSPRFLNTPRDAFCLNVSYGSYLFNCLMSSSVGIHTAMEAKENDDKANFSATIPLFPPLQKKIFFIPKSQTMWQAQKMSKINGWALIKPGGSQM